MSKFDVSFAQNKLRIPMSAFTDQIIENDCLLFSKNRATLINAIILNYYERANCSISLRLNEYQKEITKPFSIAQKQSSKISTVINDIISVKEKELRNKYNKKLLASSSKPTPLNKRVRELLTSDPYSQEEKYYNKPGRYIQALIEEYAQLPFYFRESIIFKPTLDKIKEAIFNKYTITIRNIKGKLIRIKPYEVLMDPLSMYHYIIGYNLTPYDNPNEQLSNTYAQVICLRLSRIVDVEIQYYQSGALSKAEEEQIKNEINKKGVQFVSGEISHIKIRLSDAGIQKYNAQIHLRPNCEIDKSDEHIFYFTCTERQVLNYFLSFGKDARILSPSSLADEFKIFYEQAIQSYQ